MRKHLLFFFLFLPVLVIAQKHDHVWLFGHSSQQNPLDSAWGTSIIDFNYVPPKIFYDGYKTMNFLENNASISDSEGNLQYSSNGIYLQNSFNERIDNSLLYSDVCPTCSVQGSLILPSQTDGVYFHIYKTWGYIGNSTYGKEIYYSKINMKENFGKGKILEKDVLILKDTMDYDKLTACRHGNGKDWWILSKKANSNEYVTILFDGNDFQVSNQKVGRDFPKGLGQAIFSPDGLKYAIISHPNEMEGWYLNLYDFDRCTGKLTNHFSYNKPNVEFAGGGAFSANSRFLYIGSYDKIFQYDIWENDILRSEETVAEYDGYQHPVVFSSGQIFNMSTLFWLMQIGPDGKIYVNGPGDVQVLHTIEEPDKKGELCNVKQHSIVLPTVNGSLPNFPNYRLGALESSLCDTLTSNSFDLEDPDRVRIYPNPNQGNFNIALNSSISSEASLVIYNLSGKLIFEKTFFHQDENENIDLNGFASGIYICKIWSNNQIVKTDRLVIIE